LLRGGQAIASVPQGQLDDERRKRVRGRHRRDPCSRIGPLQSRSPADLVHWQRDSRRQLGRQRPHRPLGQRVDSNVWRRRPSTKSNDCGWKRHRRWRRAPLTGHAPEWHWASTEFVPPPVIGLFQHHSVDVAVRNARAAARPPMPAPTIATRVTESPLRPARRGSAGPRRWSTRPRGARRGGRRIRRVHRSPREQPTDRSPPKGTVALTRHANRSVRAVTWSGCSAMVPA
jgi:hypothetical protein